MADHERRQYAAPQSPPEQFYIGRTVLGKSLRTYITKAAELAREKGYEFHGPPYPFALRQLTLSQYGLAKKGMAESVLSQVPEEMRARTPHVWVSRLGDVFADSERIRRQSGWIKRTLFAVLQPEEAGDPRPGFLAEERLFLASSCGASPSSPRDEGKITIGRVGLQYGKEYDEDGFIKLLAKPIPIALGPLEVISEPLRQRALIRQADLKTD